MYGEDTLIDDCWGDERENSHDFTFSGGGCGMERGTDWGTWGGSVVFMYMVRRLFRCWLVVVAEFTTTH